MKYSFRTIYDKCRVTIDSWRGLDFIIGMYNKQAETSAEIANVYHPSYAPLVKKILKDCHITNKDVFCDMGSGKGDVLRVAHHFPFKKIIGVELSSKIYNIALNNSAKLKWENVELINANAVDFTGIDEINYFFFYNPFPDTVFSAVMDNINNSINRLPREVTIIYHNPVCDNIVTDRNFKIIKSYPSSKLHSDVNIYKSAK